MLGLSGSVLQVLVQPRNLTSHLGRVIIDSVAVHRVGRVGSDGVAVRRVGRAGSERMAVCRLVRAIVDRVAVRRVGRAGSDGVAGWRALLIGLVSALVFAQPTFATQRTTTIGTSQGDSSLVLARTALAEPRSSTIGASQKGVPLVMYAFGDGPRRVLILGGQHGGPEANTVELVGGLLEFFDANPDQIPSGIELDVLPVANPDGLAAGSRQFASGVDPDRNWGGGDWRADAYDSNAVFRVGLGGPEPFSEQETRALGDWVLANKPAFIVNYHSAGGFMFGSRDGAAGALSSAYAEASGYSWPAPGGRSPLPYSASGSMNVWLREAGVPAILVELSTPRVTEVERNLAGLVAVFQQLGAGAGATSP
jgi:murein peptide amidase A